jgi:hypothetical protein
LKIFCEFAVKKQFASPQEGWNLSIHPDEDDSDWLLDFKLKFSDINFRFIFQVASKKYKQVDMFLEASSFRFPFWRILGQNNKFHDAEIKRRFG